MEGWRNSKDYMNAYGALYGNEKPIIKIKRKKSRLPTEYDEQVRFVNWLDDEGIKHYAIPNGRTNAGEGAKYRASGAVPGVPDLCIPYARKSLHGLYIELKRISGGVVSAQQREWLQFLNDEGFKAVVCKGFDEAKKVVEDYFGD